MLPKETVVVTGSGGLVGSESVLYFGNQGYHIIGVDNDGRKQYFGLEASTGGRNIELQMILGDRYTWIKDDIRKFQGLESLFYSLTRGDNRVKAVIHTAAQPSHDWAATNPLVDYYVNAVGTLNILEAVRKYCPKTPFIYTSTNKVYGDKPNSLDLIETNSRYELPKEHVWYRGIDETMSIDQSLHSLFGVSKTSGDLLVQEYGRYFDMNTVCFRCGCITGPEHRGAEQHGFLSYLMKCAVSRKRYTIYGYDGKQVRDNIHAEDLVKAFDEFIQNPGSGEVYNIGGGRYSNCSVLEAIDLCELIAGKGMDCIYDDEARIGDHKWWITSNEKFRRDYPNWSPRYNVKAILEEIYQYEQDS